MSDQEDAVADMLDRHLIERRTVFLRGEISKESADSVREKLLLLQSISSDPIHLLIDSCGGSIVYALRISDFINGVLTAPVVGVVMGDCFSAATLVLLHCSKRVCTPNATFLIHSSTQVVEVALIADHKARNSIDSMFKDILRTKEMAVQVYMSKLGLTRKDVDALFRRGDQRFNDQLHAKDALKLGLVTEIVHTKLDIFEPHDVVIGS
jgi:ATP-dependent protease ClpP protease subunit